MYAEQPSYNTKRTIVKALDVVPPPFPYNHKNFSVSYTRAHGFDQFVITRFDYSVLNPPPPTSSIYTAPPPPIPAAPPSRKRTSASRASSNALLPTPGAPTTSSTNPVSHTAPSKTPRTRRHYPDGRPVTPGTTITSAPTATPGPSQPLLPNFTPTPHLPLTTLPSSAVTTPQRLSSVYLRLGIPRPIPIHPIPSLLSTPSTGSHPTPIAVTTATNTAPPPAKSPPSSRTSPSTSSSSSTTSEETPPLPSAPLTDQSAQSQLQELLKTTSRDNLLRLLTCKDPMEDPEVILKHA